MHSVLVTDGVSSTDPTVVASVLKSSGDNILFTIGVASYSRDQLEPLSSLYTDGSTLFFGISSFQVFDIIASYLKTAYNTTAVQYMGTKVRFLVNRPLARSAAGRNDVTNLAVLRTVRLIEICGVVFWRELQKSKGVVYSLFICLCTTLSQQRLTPIPQLWIISEGILNLCTIWFASVAEWSNASRLPWYGGEIVVRTRLGAIRVVCPLSLQANTIRHVYLCTCCNKGASGNSPVRKTSTSSDGAKPELLQNGGSATPSTSMAFNKGAMPPSTSDGNKTHRCGSERRIAVSATGVGIGGSSHARPIHEGLLITNPMGMKTAPAITPKIIGLINVCEVICITHAGSSRRSEYITSNDEGNTGAVMLAEELPMASHSLDGPSGFRL
uniref:Uncharacterized protein n=1 Tax=Timema bartmani TaxID=61472 RepID=A0A7R9I6K6_9NEOP|nr:unnamed protein product [Timema bartmani]